MGKKLAVAVWTANACLLGIILLTREGIQQGDLVNTESSLPSDVNVNNIGANQDRHTQHPEDIPSSPPSGAKPMPEGILKAAAHQDSQPEPQPAEALQKKEPPEPSPTTDSVAASREAELTAWLNATLSYFPDGLRKLMWRYCYGGHNKCVRAGATFLGSVEGTYLRVEVVLVWVLPAALVVFAAGVLIGRLFEQSPLTP